MNTFLWGLLAALSTMILIAMSSYCIMLSLGCTEEIKKFHKATFQETPFRISFMILVGIGFAVCFYQGANTMLFWLSPVDLRETLAILVALVAWTTILPSHER